MLKTERQKLILEYIKTHSKSNLNVLGKRLKVSYDSIRRDVIELEDKGLLKKVHGGIVSNSYLDILSEQPKNSKSSPELSTIIKKAITLIEANQIIMLDGGTSNFFLGENLPKNIPFTLITNNIPLSLNLSNYSNINLIILGGTYYNRYQITMGTSLLNKLRDFRVDLYFMGINGLTESQGFTIRHYEESILKKEMMSISSKTACLVLEEKLGIKEAFKVCDHKNIDYLISNLDPDDKKLKDFKPKIIL